MLTGLDRLLAAPERLASLARERVALLAHPASVTRDLVHARVALHAAGVDPVIIFGPEHGYGGEAQDMIGVAHARDAFGTPVRSLYGDQPSDLSPAPTDLDGVDRLIIDLQDVGARYYTFIWTALLALRAAVARGIRVLVLDRPNPLGGDPRWMEGKNQEEGYTSFVGLEPMPIRHGLSLGEVVAWRAHVEGVPRDLLEVLRVKDLDPSAHAPAWDRPFVMPSPNMPAYETAIVYPGACLVEGTNLSEGRGTTRPFEIIGAPWLDGAALARDFNAADVAGARARPVTFLPTFHKHARQVCGGVEIHVTDPRAFRPVRAYGLLVALAHRQDSVRFRFRTERYEFVDDIPAFDLLTGSASGREAILAGALPADVASEIAESGTREMQTVRDAAEAGERFAG
jgi:uncharacterized protein YbbC (DUF1343 family)